MAAPSSHVNVSGTYKKINKMYVNVSGTWKEIKKAYVNVGGVWKKIHALQLEGAFVANNAASNASGQQNWTFNSTNFGSASADRYLVAALNVGTASSVTIGGVSATQVSGLTNIYLAAVPTGTSGTVQINMPNAFTTRVAFGLYAITGPLNTTPFDTQATSGAGGTSISIDAASGGIVIATATALGSSTNPTCAWTGLTENYDQPAIVGGGTGFGHSGAFSEFDSSQTVSGSTSWSNGNQTLLNCVSFAPQ